MANALPWTCSGPKRSTQRINVCDKISGFPRCPVTWGKSSGSGIRILGARKPINARMSAGTVMLQTLAPYVRRVWRGRSLGSSNRSRIPSSCFFQSTIPQQQLVFSSLYGTRPCACYAAKSLNCRENVALSRQRSRVRVSSSPPAFSTTYRDQRRFPRHSQ